MIIYRSTGFILEGFPRTPEETRYLAESGLFPDSAVVLTVDDSDVTARLLPPKLDKWKVKRDKRLAKRQKKKEKAQKKRVCLIAYLRQVINLFSYSTQLSMQRSGVSNMSGYRCASDCRSEVASSILAGSHTFVKIDHEIVSTVILLPSAESFKKGCCQLQAKVCA